MTNHPTPTMDREGCEAARWTKKLVWGKAQSGGGPQGDKEREIEGEEKSRIECPRSRELQSRDPVSLAGLVRKKGKEREGEKLAAQRRRFAEKKLLGCASTNQTNTKAGKKIRNLLGGENALHCSCDHKKKDRGG